MRYSSTHNLNSANNYLFEMNTETTRGHTIQTEKIQMLHKPASAFYSSFRVVNNWNSLHTPCRLSTESWIQEVSQLIYFFFFYSSAHPHRVSVLKVKSAQS